MQAPHAGEGVRGIRARNLCNEVLKLKFGTPIAKGRGRRAVAPASNPPQAADSSPMLTNLPHRRAAECRRTR
jgi:hypothetical protein